MAPRKKSRVKLYEQCAAELRKIQQECHDTLHVMKDSLATEITGDEGDMSRAIEERNKMYAKRRMLERRLAEVNSALERIKDETYGMCEETGEDIEEKRLMAIPWTRYSLEGAELRERTQRRFASSAEGSADFGWSEGSED